MSCASFMARPCKYGLGVVKTSHGWEVLDSGLIQAVSKFQALVGCNSGLYL